MNLRRQRPKDLLQMKMGKPNFRIVCKWFCAVSMERIERYLMLRIEVAYQMKLFYCEFIHLIGNITPIY